MQFDITVFSWINGFAGRWAALDAAGRYFAVFGLLAVLLLVATVAWWGKPVGVRRGAYVSALGIAASCCLLLFALDWVVTTQLLQHPVRGRPANAIWTTLLIAEESSFGFPAWSALLAAALALPTFYLFRRAGQIAVLITALLGIALVFVGVNYPLDVLTGLFIGTVIGTLASASSGITLPRERAPWRRPTVVAGALVVWCGLLGVSLSPASTLGDARSGVEPTGAAGIRVTPPLSALTAIEHAADAPITLEAASNGHRLAAVLGIVVKHDAALEDVQTTARNAVNAAFEQWEALDILTITVTAAFPRESGSRMGTLYTATVERAAWPPAGITPRQPIPGKKYFHPRYYAQPDAQLSAPGER